MSDHAMSPNDLAVEEELDDPATHGATDRMYVMVAIFLAVMTALEVVCSYTEHHLGPAYDWVLLFIMAIKFFCVALFFMHLKYDKKMAQRVFFFGLSIAVTVYVAMLATFQYWATGFR